MEGMEMNEENRVAYQVRSTQSKFETREADGEMYISGYFAVFNSEYEIPSLWRGVAPQACCKFLKGPRRKPQTHEPAVAKRKKKKEIKKGGGHDLEDMESQTNNDPDKHGPPPPLGFAHFGVPPGCRSPPAEPRRCAKTASPEPPPLPHF